MKKKKKKKKKYVDNQLWDNIHTYMVDRAATI